MSWNSAILCVDDEVMVLEMLKEQLQRNLGDNYLFELAEGPEEAWEIIEDLDENNIQLLIVVSDWLMPNIRGDEFLVQVHQKFPEIVNIMLTGQADAAAIERTKQEANLYACIHKPWQEPELMTAVCGALGA